MKTSIANWDKGVDPKLAAALIWIPAVMVSMSSTAVKVAPQPTPTGLAMETVPNGASVLTSTSRVAVVVVPLAASTAATKGTRVLQPSVAHRVALGNVRGCAEVVVRGGFNDGRLGDAANGQRRRRPTQEALTPKVTAVWTPLEGSLSMSEAGPNKGVFSADGARKATAQLSELSVAVSATSQVFPAASNTVAVTVFAPGWRFTTVPYCPNIWNMGTADMVFPTITVGVSPSASAVNIRTPIWVPSVTRSMSSRSANRFPTLVGSSSNPH